MRLRRACDGGCGKLIDVQRLLVPIWCADCQQRPVVVQTEYPHGTPVDRIFTPRECEERRRRLAWEAVLRKLGRADSVEGVVREQV